MGNADKHVRNRYYQEIQIFIKRLEILQGQVEAHEDLTGQIASKEKEVRTLEVIIKWENKTLQEKKAELRQTEQAIAEAKSEESKVQENINKWKKLTLEQNKDYKKWEDRTEKRIKQNEIRIKKAKQEKDKIDQEVKDKKIEQWLFEKNYWFKNNKLFEKARLNDLKLIEQAKEEKEILDSLKELKDDYKELDEDYQKLLELYIIKT